MATKMLELWSSLQLLLVVLWLVSVWAVRAGGPLANRRLRLLLLLGVALLLLPLPTPEVSRLVPLQAEFEAIRPVTAGVASLAAPGAPVRVAAEGLAVFLVGSALLVFSVQLGRTVVLCRNAVVRLRCGAITVAIAEVPAPRTLWLGRHWILLDPQTAASAEHRDLAVQHEVQHIRHGDTLWAWVNALLVAVSAPNPFAWLFVRNLTELDEHGVDHALVARPGVSARAYGRLLLSTATGGSSVLALAAGLSPKTPLHRRLQMLENARPTRILPWITASLLLGSVAFARPALPMATDLDARIAATNHHGVVVPDTEVVQQAWDRFTVGRGQAFLERALERREDQRAFILDALAKAELPAQLEAVALIESGYDDQLLMGDPTSESGPRGAGLWMFIPSTARQYGLVVTPDRDDRLDRELETEAAIALLSDLYEEFGDWGLALAGYNQGARHVRAAIEREGTRDVSTLVEAGALNRYVPMVWAAMLILEGEKSSSAAR